MPPLHVVFGLSCVLFGIGMFGFLARRNIILMLISIEVMLNAVNLSLAAFSWQHDDPRGQVMALFVIAVAEIGRALFGPYALPFEIASLILLAAIVGAIVLAKKKAGES